MMNEDMGLMLAAKNGDDNAFAELCRRCRGRVIRYARRYLRDAHAAEDAAQETFIKLYRAKDSYEPSGSFDGFLLRITANTCLNTLRKKREALATDDTDVEGEATEHTPEDFLIGRDLERRTNAVLVALPDQQRRAFMLLRGHQLDYAEIAEAMGLSPSAVKALLNRARRCLLDHLTPMAVAA